MTSKTTKNAKNIVTSYTPPSYNVIDPSVFIAVTLDDVSRKLTNMIDLLNEKFTNLSTVNNQILQKIDSVYNQTKLTNDKLDLSIEQQRLIFEQQKLTLDQQQLTLDQQRLATKELQDDADEGAYIIKADTVSSSEFYIIDTQVDPGHMIKGYTIHNDGENSIYVGHNVAQSSIGPDLVGMVDANLNSATNRFNLVKSCERYQYSINRKKIKNIYLLATQNTSQFRITLIW